MQHSCKLDLAHGTWVCKPGLGEYCQRPRGALSIGERKLGLRKGCKSHQPGLPQASPSILSPSPSISPDVTVNWLLFILHALTFQVPRKMYFNTPLQQTLDFILAERSSH